MTGPAEDRLGLLLYEGVGGVRVRSEAMAAWTSVDNDPRRAELSTGICASRLLMAAMLADKWLYVTSAASFLGSCFTIAFDDFLPPFPGLEGAGAVHTGIAWILPCQDCLALSTSCPWPCLKRKASRSDSHDRYLVSLEVTTVVWSVVCSRSEATSRLRDRTASSSCETWVARRSSRQHIIMIE
jgi:hypothetical protein